jgi:predicted RNA-binding Zn-ribbon protein involved in translation (DUF1610 family)
MKTIDLPKHSREDWLRQGLELLLVEVIEPVQCVNRGVGGPRSTYVSVGFPKGSKGKSGPAIGQCWSGTSSADGNPHVFISPTLVDPDRVLDVLLHELGHVIVGNNHGHRKPFSDFCRKVGLVKPWTATTASPELREKLNNISIKLGAYPHSGLTSLAGVKKQTTRMRKYKCPACGQIVRAATDTLNASCLDCNVLYALDNGGSDEA